MSVIIVLNHHHTTFAEVCELRDRAEAVLFSDKEASAVQTAESRGFGSDLVSRVRISNVGSLERAAVIIELVSPLGFTNYSIHGDC